MLGSPQICRQSTESAPLRMPSRYQLPMQSYAKETAQECPSDLGEGMVSMQATVQ